MRVAIRVAMRVALPIGRLEWLAIVVLEGAVVQLMERSVGA